MVYENAMAGEFYVFKDGGSYSAPGPAYKLSCPELSSSSTVHIFDCKAGNSAREPMSSSAKLIVTSSTNSSGY